jgi:hypothetical protein
MNLIDNTNKKVAFFDEFIDEYLSRGFTNMSKRDLDVLIFYLLNKYEAFKDMSNYEIARKLRTTPGKVKNAKYESVLRFDNDGFDDEFYLKDALKNYFDNPVLNLDEKWLYIQIEDPVLLDALKAKLKEGGSLFDGSFNSELVKISADDYSNLLEKLIYCSDEERFDEAIVAFKNLKESSFSAITKKIFTKAIEDKGSEGITFIGKQTFKLLSGQFSEVLKIIEPIIN